MTKYLNYTVLDNFFADHFQRMMIIRIENEVVYDGKLFLFKNKNYSYQLTLSKEKSRKFNVSIPIPFSVTILNDGLAELDYTIEALTDDPIAINIIKRLRKPQKSVFYNKRAVVEFKNA